MLTLNFNFLKKMKGLTGIFLFASTTSRSDAALLGWNCGYSFTSTVRIQIHNIVVSWGR